MSKHAVIVMMMETEMELSIPAPNKVHLTNKEYGLIGMMPVYESKKAARKVWGDKVRLQRISSTNPMINGKVDK